MLKQLSFPVLIGLVVGITSVTLTATSAQAQSRASVINLNHVRLCRSESDLRSLARYLRDQKDFGITAEGLNNWIDVGGLNVRRATEEKRILVTGSVVAKTNGMKTTIKDISVTLPLMSGANRGDIYNAAAAVLRARGTVVCLNNESNRVGKVFNINSRYDFSWEDVKIQDLRQSPTDSSEQDGIVITSY